MFEYIVQPGDYLYSIADKFDVSVEAILAANPGLSPLDIYPGLVILIPVSAFLYQRYPWYIDNPILFLRYPRTHWDDRRHWPSRFPSGDVRPPRPPRPPAPPPPRPPRPPGPKILPGFPGRGPSGSPGGRSGSPGGGGSPGRGSGGFGPRRRRR